jgi:hypothetical protein
MADFNVAGAVSGVQSVLGTAAGVLNTAANLGAALNSNLSNPARLLSAIRSINLPVGGEAISSIVNSAASFGGTDNTNDWRARLSMPTGSFFDRSPILQPLISAGGLIFPYTPTISINSTATYGEIPVTHQNYQFQAYQNSRVSDIQITGEFNVEDAVQAKYWIAVVHFLRSVTKMFTGDTAFQGNPPPILNFSAYGDHVFRNVPVVVKSFSMTLPKDVQYISTNVSTFGTGGLGNISQEAGQLAGVAGAFGLSSAAQSLGQIGAVAGAASTLTNLFSGTAGAQGVPRDSHVPVKSDLTITIMPIYSKEAVRQFSLQKFVNGDYVSRGYI